MKKILLTGFSGKKNPSRILVEEIGQELNSTNDLIIKTVILDSDYVKCENELNKELQDFNPDYILSFGVSPEINMIELERIAINMDDSSLADESGIIRQGRKIRDDGENAYFSTLPIDKLYEEINKENIPDRRSNYAGNYLCNHILYYGLYSIEKNNLKTSMGFIHIPIPLRRKEDKDSITIDDLKKVVKICLQTLKDY